MAAAAAVQPQCVRSAAFRGTSAASLGILTQVPRVLQVVMDELKGGGGALFFRIGGAVNWGHNFSSGRRCCGVG